MARKPDIGNVQLYPDRPLRPGEKNGYVLKFYCPILGKRVRKNCGTHDRRDARRIQRECRDRLLNGEYGTSGAAITAADAKESWPCIVAREMRSLAGSGGKLPGEVQRTLDRSRRLKAEPCRANIENRRKAMKLPPGIALSDCLTDDGIEVPSSSLACRRRVPLHFAGHAHGELDRAERDDLRPLLQTEEVDRSNPRCGKDRNHRRR